jgi:hypothetical protein
MQTDLTSGLFGFSRVEKRKVVASFDGGAVISDAGGLFLGTPCVREVSGRPGNLHRGLGGIFA